MLNSEPLIAPLAVAFIKYVACEQLGLATAFLKTTELNRSQLSTADVQTHKVIEQLMSILKLMEDMLVYCIKRCGSVAEWLTCWTQAQKGLCSIRSRDDVG